MPTDARPTSPVLDAAGAAPGRTRVRRTLDALGAAHGWPATLAVGGVAAALRLPALDRPRELVFDETYYVKDAWTLLNLGYEGDWPDDHAAELSPVPLHPLAGATSSWAFVRSVSKPYGPDLRLAVVSGDEATVARVVGRMRLGSGWVSTLLQRLVVELWSDPDVSAAVAAARDTYAARRSALVAALGRRGVAASGRTGVNVWVPVPDETRAVTALRDRGVAVAPGARFRLASAPGVRITVGPLAADDVEPLAALVAEALAAPGRGFTT